MAFNKEKEAKNVYKLFQEVCDGYKFRYSNDDEKLSVKMGVQGDHYSVEYLMKVNPNIDVAYILSKLPFEVEELCSDDVAQAVNVINSKLAFGSMDYSRKSGEIVYRIASNYTGMEMTKDAVSAMVLYTYSCVNKYNRLLHQVAKGEISFDKFSQMVEGA